MNELNEQYRAQIEALQKELERTKKRLKKATALIQEFQVLLVSEIQEK